MLIVFVSRFSKRKRDRKSLKERNTKKASFYTQPNPKKQLTVKKKLKSDNKHNKITKQSREKEFEINLIDLSNNKHNKLIIE